MTKRFFYAASAFLMLSACTQELVSNIQEQSTLKEGGATIAATINDEPATRVAVDQAGVEGKTTLKWETGDRLLVASGQRGYTFKGYFAATDIDGDFAMFQEETGSTGSFSATKVNEAYYPAAAWEYSDSEPVYTFPAEQVYSEGTFDRHAMPMVASSNDGNFAFSIESAVLRLNVSTAVESVTLNKITLTSKNHNLSGQAVLSYTDFLKPSSGEGTNSVSLLCADAGINSTAKPFYIVVPAGTYEAGDLVLAFEANTGDDAKTSARAFTFEVGKVYDMNLNISPEKVNLSADGTANCYIVSEYGPCKFDATKKGNSDESVGDIASAEVLWESFGTSTTPAKGDIVSNVSVKNGIVSFTASGKDGNAVIAVKNAAGDILWSWHIWVCKDFDPAAAAQVYKHNAGIVMDRNLGATSATKGDVKALGLLYQWGRKDPFLSGSSISSDTKQAKSTITWPSTVKSDASNGTIDFVVKHPTTFVTYNSSNYDWYYTGSSSTDNTRWNSSKGMYDPCPKGWKVPDGGSNGLWAKAFGRSSDWTTPSNWDSPNKGMDFGSTDKKLGSGEIWYPASGSLSIRDGTLTNVGSRGSYWSCTPYGYNAYYLYFGTNGYVGPSDGNLRGYGQSVRCVKESTPAPEPEAKDLSADGTANCYIVNEYGPCKFDATKKGNSDEPVGDIASAEVLWESFGTSSTPVKGDIVSNVSVKNGIVSFTASGKDGNAVIAVKDANGTILWSWHIWVCKDFDPAVTAQVYNNNAGTVMDRNLGATSNAKGASKSYGLLYQWGRKDPFLGSSSISSNTKAKSTITWPSTVSSDSSNGTIDYVVKHPTTFVAYNSSNKDWYYTGDSSTDNTRWNSDKGMYDPCPKGWKVPDGGSNGLWAKAFGTSSWWITSSNWDSTNNGMDFGSTDKKLGSGEIWYPASGYLYGYDGSLGNVGIRGYYWSCTPNGYNGYYAHDWCFNRSGYVYPSGGDSCRADGLSVRCLQE